MRARTYMKTTENSFEVVGLGRSAADWKTTVLTTVEHDPDLRSKLEDIALPLPIVNANPVIGADLIMAYKAEYTIRYRSNAHFLKFDRYQKCIEDCHVALQHAGIAPATWISYSFALWTSINQNKRRNAPAIPWVLSRHRVLKEAAACRTKTTTVALVVWPKSAKALMYRWHACWDDIYRSRAYDSVTALRAIVAKHWPRRQFDSLYNRAVADCKQTHGTAAV